ncbi:MAG: hypothetical protein KUA35_07070 [Pseudodesulfovibrio sp.]|uniref:Uncharacterized protein n=1 Tax=Pseudodesulfovibrio aespoeensis (strain ATCC 700646 / DSM 10631 / Aspo-2) TaxID=643562 RepID=E6VXQ7_PSEA9|nr:MULTISPECIES: hypothetical protein [Pseudodesulfovibrio]ADU61515.1 hypothetical protein Daes_0494 [Pseudodesulfovibrio aespoeensis Aspo-2]MBV1763738.1 hypothetical protein [Pseudodesulfovibrio sp.]MBV1772174.1 hypothetical protein [Pseudodesulfovibrio sp.]MCG2734384.1 hypothetical protein [Pseudodesulfovibrio aespoeensis]
MAKENDMLLGPIVSEEIEKKKEYALRKDPVYFKTVKRTRLDSYLDEGWEYVKKLKTGIKIQKPRSYDEVVENKMWCLLYKMGFNDLNSTRNFKIKYKLSGKNTVSKQIDVFAKDDDTVVVVECKSAEELKPKGLASELSEFSNLRTRLSNSIKKHYGDEFKPKIIWIFYTSNIIWSKIDTEKARDHRIKIITDREYDYLNQIVNHLGAAARYQFLAEYCGGEAIPNLKNKPVPAIKGRLGGRYFYSFVTTPEHLLKIAFVNHRALDDPKGIPTYQRLVQKSRIKQIEQFIQGGGYFPTNILINFTHNLDFQV